MTRNPLDPITVDRGYVRIAKFHPSPRAIEVGASGGGVGFDMDVAPAVASAILTLAREMGADVPDADAVIRGLVATTERLNSAVDKMWNDNDRVNQPFRLKMDHVKAISEAQQALPAALAAARDYLAGRG